jgi:hypothetical protein
MSIEHASAGDPRIDRALAELQRMIQAKYPAATFTIAQGEDPAGTYLTPTVDVDDPEQVFDVVADRLLELQVEERLPVYVIPVRPIERILRSRQARQHPRARAWEQAPLPEAGLG